MRAFAVFLAGAATMSLALYAMQTEPETLPKSDSVLLPKHATNIARLEQLRYAPLVSCVSPAVINIAVVHPSPLSQNPLLRDPFFRHFVGVSDDDLKPQLAVGTGLIVDARRGLIVTNYHMVEEALVMATLYWQLAIRSVWVKPLRLASSAPLDADYRRTIILVLSKAARQSIQGTQVVR